MTSKKPSCAKHQKHLSDRYENVGPLELAESLGDLRYDGLADYLVALAKKLRRDSESDGGRGRGKLADALHRASYSLLEATSAIEDAWDICEPYMKEEK